MSTKNIFGFILVVLGICALVFVYKYYVLVHSVPHFEPVTFEECRTMYPVTFDEPKKCTRRDGVTFEEPVATTTEEAL
jgi:hypothetical protein